MLFLSLTFRAAEQLDQLVAGRSARLTKNGSRVDRPYTRWQCRSRYQYIECKSHAPSASSVAEPLIHLQAFTDIVFDLAAHPEYVAPMREEVEAIIEAEGWTKASIGKMHKVDSFVKESQRIGIGGSTFSFPEPPQINDS